MRVRAAVVHEKSGPFVLEEIELDEPRSDEILVRVVATGVCQTDVHIRNQEYPVPLPIVLGHEGAGVVDRVGEAVAGFEPGDHVVLSYQSCGRCRACLTGHASYCDLAFEANFGGARLDGTSAYHSGTAASGQVHGHFFGQSSFATFALATERNAVKVPRDVPLELLAPLGCGLQTGAGAVLNSLRVREGASIAIFGTGSVGLAAVMAARVAGADPIIAVDVRPARLALATELGATEAIDARLESLGERITAIAGGGVDHVLEITAQPEMLKLALDVLAPLGTAGLIGGAPEGTLAPIDMNTLLMGRTVRGIVQGDAIPQLFIPHLIELQQAGKFPFERLVRFYDFDDINQAVADTQSGTAIKPVLRVGRG